MSKDLIPRPVKLSSLQQAIDSGALNSASISLNRNGSQCVIADAGNGNERIILETKTSAYLTEESKTRVRRPPNREARLDIVEDLHMRGMTQKKIALRTMVSQATVSNDVWELKLRGRL